MPFYIYIIIIIFALYITWCVFNYVQAVSGKLNINWNLAGTSNFNVLLRIAISAIVIARLSWLIFNLQYVKEIGFWLLPYTRSGSQIIWLQYYPWRFFVFSEGIHWLTFKIVLLVSMFIILVFNPVARVFKAKKIKTTGLKFRTIVILLGWYSIMVMLIWLMFR